MDAHSLAVHGDVAHQFDDAVQQRESAELGMWLFLITEIMFFGGLFLGYTVYRTAYEPVWARCSHHLDVALGAVNTGVLLTSSLTMALAVGAAQAGRRRAVVGYIAATIVLGAVFLGVKAYEYHHKYEDGLIPFFGWTFDPHGELEKQGEEGAELYFTLYFIMTGVHAFHMVIGMVILAIMAGLYGSGKLRLRATPVELIGLYWHFVDIVWIFLYPFFYLVNPRDLA